MRERSLYIANPEGADADFTVEVYQVRWNVKILLCNKNCASNFMPPPPGNECLMRLLLYETDAESAAKIKLL